MNKSIDPRVIRTRRLLMDAFTELIVEKGVGAITVRDIVRKAEVNRSTFYLHFHGKQDILDQMQDNILNGLEKSLEISTDTYELAMQNFQNSKKPIPSLLTMFEHIQEHASIYQTMLAEGEFRERMTQVIRREGLRFQLNFLEAAFTSNGMVGVILYWLENGMKESIDEMSLLLTQVALFSTGKFN